MLDTIILQFRRTEYSIIDYSYFGTTKQRVDEARGFKKWVNNPSAEDKDKCIYRPRLTLMKRGYGQFLKVEFSAPKLIFKNNLDELKETDFNLVVKNLQEKLKAMKIVIFTKHIEEAEVISFHPSKNIQLENGYTTSLAIAELSKVDINKRFDLDTKNYRNNGEVLQLYTKGHSIVIYDKINDLTKPTKRAIDKKQVSNQISLLDLIKKENSRLEILRIEIRLSTKRKMNQVLRDLGLKQNPSFKDIFQESISQKVLKHYWNTLFNNQLFIFNVESSPQSIIKIIFRKFPKIKVIKAINIIGMYVLARDKEGIRGLRQIINGHKSNTNWLAVKKYIEVLEDEIFNNEPWGFIKSINTQLEQFEPFRLKTEVDM